MLNPKIEAEIVKNKVITAMARCPICDAFSTYMHYMRDAKSKLESLWYQCNCGTLWQKDRAKNIYEDSYFNAIEGTHIKVSDCLNYSAKLYLPIIEEMIYGRKVLHVSLINDCQQIPFDERGWIFESIDLWNRKATLRNNVENHKFKYKFNMIWMPMVLECLEKPKETLLKLSETLVEDGILFIETPDTSYLSTRSPMSFVHWKKEHNNVMWNRHKLQEYLETIGFDVVMNRRNYEQRFMFVDTTHIIAQKRFY